MDGFGVYAEEFSAAEESLELAPGEADDGLVLYTSGSSANPKAVRLRRFGIV